MSLNHYFVIEDDLRSECPTGVSTARIRGVYLKRDTDPELARLREENETLRTAGASDFERANKLQSENDLLRRAVDWCLTHGAKRAHIWDEDADGGTGGLVEGIRDAGCDCCSHKLEAPAEFADIISPAAVGDGNG